MAVILDEAGGALLEESGAANILDELGLAPFSKTSGLGDDLWAGGFHVGGDIRDLMVHGGPEIRDVTTLTQPAHARLGALRDGSMSLTAYHDPAAGAEHAAFSSLPRTDVILTYCRGQAIGNPAACLNAKQVGYDPTRAASGELTFKVEGVGNAYGLEWGEQLTNGLRTDTAPANGTAQDDGTATSYGAQAYLQATALTGSTATVTIQHSPDNSTWSALATFTAVTASPAAQRVSAAGTVNRYLRAVTTGTFTSFSFQVTLVRNQVVVSF